MMDTTRLWAFMQRNDKRISQLLIAVLLFTAGWQLGRMMSPYYTSSEIIFQDRECSECPSSGGSVSQLQEFQEQGSGIARPSAGGVVAGTSQSQTKGTFVASVNSTLYHAASCSSAKRIKPENQVWFATEEEARIAGYQPSKCTLESK